MTEFEKMVAGEDFNGGDESIMQVRNQAQRLSQILSELPDSEREKRREVLRELLAEVGDNSVIRSPFLCEFGKTISVGKRTLINMNAVMLDGAPITIGDHVLIGPNAQFYTAGHPLDYRRRRNWETSCLPIVVEDDVWIGGNVVITQGVTIGARSVVAANSVVTRDVPPDSLVGGTPAKVIRHLTENE